jgi:hypothetical protein
MKMKKTLIAMAISSLALNVSAGVQRTTLFQEDHEPVQDCDQYSGYGGECIQYRYCNSFYNDGSNGDTCNGEGGVAERWDDHDARNDVVSASFTFTPEAGEQGRPVRFYIGIGTFARDAGAFLTPEGWKGWNSGPFPAIAGFDAFPSQWGMTVLDHKKLCELTDTYGETEIYIGYGILTAENEATINKFVSTGATTVRADSMRETYIQQNMLTRQNYVSLIPLQGFGCHPNQDDGVYQGNFHGIFTR